MEVAVIGPNDKIELKPITLGRNLGTEVEVVKGLSASDRLVEQPAGFAVDRRHRAHLPASRPPDKRERRTTER